MKIKTKKISLSKALAKPRMRHYKPQKPWWILRLLIRIISIPDLIKTHFKFTEERMEPVGKEPCLILMNHSSFLDLEIAYRIFFPKPFCIVSTTDGMVGKHWLMRKLGCIPTQKYISDIRLIMDMLYAVRENNCSILMYPEAGYSFDGRATTLPRKLGTLVKKMNIPLVTVITDGAFLYQPLYNNLQKRKVNVSAHVECLLTKEEIA
ncbi:MAG: 1-acyl-sn-glycerol-3-phosphate acyltransferase, partial [Clostridia bacterium]|nr:1-acyl-sn-glycerol-3-phosphate acyltransferase [Clostridia bacterium]